MVPKQPWWIIQAVIVLSIASPSFGLSTQTKAKAPIRRVAVIGSGIAGLSVAHALDVPEVHIFEGRDGMDKGGAGIQLNGGLAVMDDALRQKVWEAGAPIARISSWGRQDSESLARKKLLDIDIPNMIKESRLKSTLIANVAGNDETLWLGIMRGKLQQILHEALPSNRSISYGKKLMRLSHDVEGYVCHFADGTESQPFDVVIGCDGIRSEVKRFVESTMGEDKQSSPVYSGIRISFAVGDTAKTKSPTDRASLTQYFGNGGYALHGIYGNGANQPLVRAAYFIYLDDEQFGPFRFKKRSLVPSENTEWEQTQDQSLSKQQSTMLSRLKDCQIPDTDNELVDAMKGSDRFFDLGSYFHNPFCAWSAQVDDHFCVLCGDAAHALPPFLGQGANQAIQDAYCLADQIKEYNKQVERGNDVDLKDYLQKYKRIRWPVTTLISLKSVFLGYLEVGGQGFRDRFFQLMGFLGVAKAVLLDSAEPKK